MVRIWPLAAGSSPKINYDDITRSDTGTPFQEGDQGIQGKSEPLRPRFALVVAAHSFYRFAKSYITIL